MHLVQDCLPLHLEQFLDAQPSWRSGDTKAEVVKTIKAAFNWGHEAGIAPRNPFTGKLLRSYTFGNHRDPMTAEQFRQLVEACAEKRPLLKAILQFCYETGARPCEAREARRQDLDLDQGTITLYHHKTSKTQKGKQPRVIHLTEDVLVLLQAL
jgi:integrase